MIIGDAPLNGVYTLGSYGKNYPLTLDLTYPLSIRSGSDLVLNSIEIGSVMVCGDEIFVSWYDHANSTYGVDKIDYSNKLSGAYFITPIIPIVRTDFSNYTKFVVCYCELPASTDIQINYSKDYDQTYVATTEKTDTQRQIVYAESEGVESTVIQMKVIVTTSGNNGPLIENALIYIS